MLHRVVEPCSLRPEVQAPMSSGTLESEWSLPSLLFWALCASQIRSLSRGWPNMSGFFHIFLSQKTIISSLHHAFFWNLTTTLWSYCLFSLSRILSPLPLNINKGFWFLCSLLWGLQADIITWFKATKPVDWHFEFHSWTQLRHPQVFFFFCIDFGTPIP